jgi:peptidoglycan hydrolase-like protein with peptidoglycan-binding domain
MTKSIAQKIVAVATALTLSGMLTAPVYGATVEELQAQINALLAQIQTLQAQLAAAQGGSASGAAGYTCTFTRPLYPGVTGEDVRCLQKSLNALGFQVAASGPGSPGNETTTYGSLTKAAVAKWQAAVGIAAGAWAGYFGPASQAKYNSLKAQAPAGGEQTPPTQGGTTEEQITTKGVEAILSAEYAPSPANNPVIREGEEAPAFGVRVKAKQGDAVVERLSFVLGTSASRYTRQFSEASLWDGDKELSRVVLNSNTVVKSGSNYVVTFSGFKKLVKAGDQADLTVKLKAYAQIDPTYTNTDPTDIQVLANAVRAIDGAGINQYAPAGDLTSRSVDLQQSEGEQAELIVSRNPDYPRAYRAISDNQHVADNVVMNVIDVKAKNGRVKITDWSASLTESPNGDAVPASAYLYRKDGSSWTLIASASISGNNDWTWSDLTDEWVEKDTTNTYKIAVKFTGASSTEGGWSIDAMNAGDIVAENSLGDSVTPSVSVPASSVVRVAHVGPVYTLLSKSIKYTKAGVAGASGTLEGTFVFNVTAKGASLYTSQAANTAFTVTVIDDDGTTTTSSPTFGTLTYSQPTGTQDGGSGTWQYPEDQTVQVTLNFAILSGQLTTVTGFNMGEQYKLRLTAIKWGTSNASPAANTDSYMDQTEWETPFVMVAD